MKDEVERGAERDLVGRTRIFALDVIMFYSKSSKKQSRIGTK
jgi:hypothetical protein